MSNFASNNARPSSPTQATINVQNLRLRTYIGFNPEERLKQQDVIINLEIRYRLPGAVLKDSVGDSLNYKTITKQVIKLVEENRFLLLEKLAADILDVCSEPRDVSFARVTVDKPHALRFADSVSITLDYQDDIVHPSQLLEKPS